VYQKAYVEFFVSPEKFTSLQAAISKQTSLTYMAVTSKGDYKSNQASASVNAVTWGVFPGSEIVQPTVVDQESFLVWKVSLHPQHGRRSACCRPSKCCCN
jgi:methylenetetrahydrofolate reductase (NADPH)